MSDSSDEKIKKLEARIDYLEQGNRWYMESVNMLILMNEVYERSEDVRDTATIFEASTIHVSQLFEFELIAFFMVNDEDASFNLEHVFSKNEGLDAELLKESLIDSGEFAWAISQNRTVEVDSDLLSRKVLMHVLTTKNRVRGMFVALPFVNHSPSSAVQNLLSVVLQNSAHVLESCSLYDVVKNKNKELSVANSQLEEKVAEKTIDLQSALVCAEEATKAKSQFLANMSHEIRTPMNAIIGFSHLLQQDEMPEKQMGYVKQVDVAGKQLLCLINDILDFSKIEAGKLDIEVAPFDLIELIHDLKGMVGFLASEKSILLKFEVPENFHCHVKGDVHRLKQILTNLFSNAIKFTSKGSVSFVLSNTYDSEEKRVYTKFSVTDTGIGMTEKQIDNLFQSFSQADTSTTRKYGGTGLGLSISQQLAQLMGGEITVSSESSVGTTFTLSLDFPCQDEGDSRQHEVSKDKFNVDEQLMLLQGKRILLVEDNLVNQVIATEILKRQGIIVVLAKNGQEAVEMDGLREFDLVLMDLQMPVMDGYDATINIRTQLSADELPIIAMTADAMKEVEGGCFKVGMNDYVAKPIDVDEFHRTLLQWLA